jgi:CheY-like chemotaxis protein
MSVPTPTKRKILVVEDEPQVCEVIRMLLSIDGHEVITAASGKEALELFDQGGFDVVITDYHMPVMRGDELSAALKARRPGQPVIMVTAYAEMLKGSGIKLTGVDQLVSKPFQLQELREAVQKTTGSPT